jgi:hypothetical protein
MAQTTTMITGAAAKVSIWDANTTPAAYHDISGSSQAIETATVAYLNSDNYTFDGDGPLTLLGKIEPVEITVNVYYTETATEAFEIVQKMFAEKDATKIKWQLAGASGSTFETGMGKIVSMDYPGAEADSGDGIMASFVLRVPSISYTT